ncbi:hydrocephalus-inducing protein homolog isoform X2 [Cuculus canorus]|uniref:hydrocephalus-inducing protein homolog isoform X2 n=1 Tax=Cuculus canorus TaxID=55661 RepID=UPI0023AA70DE|nr:hydrocephalus-inducing protein homolog isoform X2 [Cuculus canorus]
MALCRVEGGPTYEIALIRDASLINCLLDVTEIDYGLQQPSDVVTLQYKPLSLKNICPLPLSVFLALEEPFLICHADGSPSLQMFRTELPEYVLDFGHVIHGSIHTHVVKIINTGRFPVSFCTGRRVLRSTGFRVEPDHVKDLPCCETESFTVHFDLESANLPLGEVDVLLPIKKAPRITSTSMPT